MADHESKRAASVYAVLAIILVLVGAMVWLGTRTRNSPVLPSANERSIERRGAAEDILPALVPEAACGEDRPCS